MFWFFKKFFSEDEKIEEVEIIEEEKVEKMKIGKEGLELIKHFEGLYLKAYLCPANVWTIGYGHTGGVYEGMEITTERAELFLKKDMEEFEDWVDKLVLLDLNQHQFDALVSWTFNLGPTNLKNSTLLKRLNSGDWDDVPNQIKRWNRAGGKVLKGLVRRRNAEALLWEGKDWRTYKDYD
jgi:lysozyme